MTPGLAVAVALSVWGSQAVVGRRRKGVEGMNKDSAWRECGGSDCLRRCDIRGWCWGGECHTSRRSSGAAAEGQGHPPNLWPMTHGRSAIILANCQAINHWIQLYVLCIFVICILVKYLHIRLVIYSNLQENDRNLE